MKITVTAGYCLVVDGIWTPDVRSLKNISEEYDDDIEEFFKTYPCNVCEFRVDNMD